MRRIPEIEKLLSVLDRSSSTTYCVSSVTVNGMEYARQEHEEGITPIAQNCLSKPRVLKSSQIRATQEERSKSCDRDMIMYEEDSSNGRVYIEGYSEDNNIVDDTNYTFNRSVLGTSKSHCRLFILFYISRIFIFTCYYVTRLITILFQTEIIFRAKDMHSQIW